MRFFFIDSNLFLQCRPLPDLDWERFAGAEEATLLIPSAVLSELDKHKSDGNNRRAQRARSALKFLDALLESDDESVVIRERPARVVARFAPEVAGDPTRSNDDSILFEVEEMVRSRGNEAVALITHDTNLKVKARRRKLGCFAVPDEWLLPPEPDERDKRVRQLEEQVATLQKRSPIFEISINEGRELKLVVAEYPPLGAQVVKDLVDEMLSRYPMKRDFSLTSSERLMSAGILGGLHPPSEYEVAKYEKAYREWADNLESRIERVPEWLYLRDGMTDVEVAMTNTGTVPAEHVEVGITVNDPMLLADPKAHDKLLERVMRQPRPPTPPGPRSSDFMKLAGMGTEFTSPHFPPDFYRGAHVREREAFYLKSGEDFGAEWIWQCEHMRHGATEQQFSSRLAVKAQSHPSGGQLQVLVSAANLPKAEERRVPIIIEYQMRDTEAAARRWLGLSH
jgi:rRNA-processing protein FCF1